MKSKTYILFLLLLVSFFFMSCKKDKLASEISAIQGKDSIPSEKAETYSVSLVDGAVYTWTVTAPFEILEGQGTYQVKIKTPTKFVSANICVTIKSVSQSEKRCKDLHYIPMWKPILKISPGRYQAFTFVLDNKAYFGGGSTQGYYDVVGDLSDLFVFNNIPADSLTHQTLPISRTDGISFVINNKAYIGFGQDLNGTYNKDLWEYDPLSGLWTQKASNSLGTAKIGAGAFVANNLGFVIAGQSASATINQKLFSYNPITNNWTQKNNTIVGERRFAEVFGYNNKGYVIGGYDNNYELKDIWSYDPTSDSWQQLPDFPGTARGVAFSFLLDDKLYYGGGNSYKDFWVWDIINGSWARQPDLPCVFSGGTKGFSLNGKGYFIGGEIYDGNTYYANDELYELK